MDARVFQEAVRSATVTYPIPFVFAVLLLFAVLCLGGCLISSGWQSILLAVLGGVSAIGAIGLVAWAFALRPEMLRSEHHVLSMRVAQMMGDKDMDPAVRERLGHLIVDPEDRPRSRYPEPPGSPGRRASEDDANGK